MSEKVFTKKMTLSICLIILCLCALSISAGAFFSDTTKSNTKTYSTATYDLTITATKQVTTLDDQDPSQVISFVPADPVAATTADPHIYELTVLPVQVDNDEGYSVRIQIKDGITATASGYCKIIIKDKTDPTVVHGTYYSKQIAIAEHTDADITTFRDLKIITEKEVIVEFIPLWGTYSGNDALTNNKIIRVDDSGNITLFDPPPANP